MSQRPIDPEVIQFASQSHLSQLDLNAATKEMGCHEPKQLKMVTLATLRKGDGFVLRPYLYSWQGSFLKQRGIENHWGPGALGVQILPANRRHPIPGQV